MNADQSLPAFNELRLDPKAPVGNAWGLFGASDKVGMLNLLTPETTREAAKEIKEGTCISLDWPLSKPSHPSFGRNLFKHRIWDGFSHYGNQKAQCFFINLTQDQVESTDTMGINAWVENGGIVGRGVLLDYAEWAERNSISIRPFESFHKGDILFIRSGFSSEYNKLSTTDQKALAERPSPDFIGLEATMETLEWIWNSGFAAVAGDAPSFERSPIAGPHHNPDVMLHQWLLAGWGMPIGELFDLEKLSDYCKKTSRRTFFLTSIPLKVLGGVASPPNAVAIF
ncbi:uncharacterized protein PAC_18521 [Phialocephala subalpina]|uniref:Cyclase n=1 Tax=Phialocephala subalpina TaxID=576137 RepID=A0A1L7XUB9_9HELO|nr:uncharacterized protein PAC_18521 [Phialocephala subalpina]